MKAYLVGIGVWHSQLIQVLNVACFSVYATAVDRGFGRHTSANSNSKLQKIEVVCSRYNTPIGNHFR